MIMRAVANPTVKPVDGKTYTANPQFGTGVDISTDGTKQYVVYNGENNSVDITGLVPGENYLVNVFSYEEPATLGTAYLTAQFATGVKQIIGAPLSQATALKAKWINGETIKLDWEVGSGQRRLIFAREGGEVSAVPTDNTIYNPNTHFGAGQQIGNGNYVVYSGGSNTTNITNLKPTKTYHFTIYEFNQFGSTTLYHFTNPAKTHILIPNPLPVTWLSFTAANKGNGVLLEWKTTAELKNKEFVVERSTDANSFTKIGAMPASTQPQSVYTYQFTDASPVNGTMHYRIKQVDLDGNYSYSKTVQVKGEESKTIQLLENPVKSNLRLKCSETFLGSRVVVVDAAGRVVYNGTITSRLSTIPVGHLQQGMYYLKTEQLNGNTVSISFLHK